MINDPEREKARSQSRTLRRRLGVAFGLLEKNPDVKIGARRKYWCCLGCGTSAAADEYKKCDLFLFYHEQDDESMSYHGDVHLAFFSPNGRFNQKTVVEAMKEHVLPALERCGLAVDWDGESNRRPRISVIPGRRVA